jgi:hypothetical protein
LKTAWIFPEEGLDFRPVVDIRAWFSTRAKPATQLPAITAADGGNRALSGTECLDDAILLD